MYVQGYDGFSLSKLTSWVKDVTTAYNKGDTVGLVGAAAAAIPGSSVKLPAATAKPVLPPQPPGIFSPGGFVDRNQTALLVGAVGLGAVLFLSMRRKGRR